MHQDIEEFYRSRTLANTREFKMFTQFHNRVEQVGYVPFASEKLVYDKELALSGVIDMLYVHKSDLRTKPLKLWMIDWKRCKSMKTEGYDGRVGLGPLQDLPDCNFQHYSIQLNVYKYLLEKNSKNRVHMMSIVTLHPDQVTYLIYHVSDRQDLVKKMLA